VFYARTQSAIQDSSWLGESGNRAAVTAVQGAHGLAANYCAEQDTIDMIDPKVLLHL
jgi:hypothetical protein